MSKQYRVMVADHRSPHFLKSGKTYSSRGIEPDRVHYVYGLLKNDKVARGFLGKQLEVIS